MPHAGDCGGQPLMKYSAYALLRFVGLLICLVSGGDLLTALWFTAAGADLAELFPGRQLLRMFGPISGDTLRLAFDA
jgi:hypothetical protein